MKAVSILGFRDVKIADVDDFLKRVKTKLHPVTIQLVDAARVGGKHHLFFAFLNAQKSFDRGQMITEDLGMETLLFASGQRQISKAIEMLGVKPHTSKLAAIIIASSEREVKEGEDALVNLVQGVRDDSVIAVKRGNKIEEVMATFGITELELETMMGSGMTAKEALTWLVVERVSLLSIKR